MDRSFHSLDSWGWVAVGRGLPRSALLGVNCYSERQKICCFLVLRPAKPQVKAEIHLDGVSSSVACGCFVLKWHMLCLVSHEPLSWVLKHSPNCLGSPATKIH